MEKEKADDDAEEDVLAVASSSDAKLRPRLTMIEQQVRYNFAVLNLPPPHPSPPLLLSRVEPFFCCDCGLMPLFVQSLLAVQQKKDKAVSDVLRKFKMSDLDEPMAPLASAAAAKGRVTPRKK